VEESLHKFLISALASRESNPGRQARIVITVYANNLLDGKCFGRVT